MAYLYLALAIFAEVVGTSFLKATEEFTKLGPSALVAVSYLISFYLMTLVLRTIPVGIAYAYWAGLGIVLVALIASVMYKQIPDLPAIIGMSLIILGVVVIQLFSKSTGH
ncbi:MAG: multidrug efflux SMR transporter [Cocleimonas sp.]